MEGKLIGIGVDVGGTYVKFTSVSEKGEVLRAESVDTQGHKGLGYVAQVIGEKLNELDTAYRGSTFAAGIGFAGDIDPDNGIVRFSPNISTQRNFKMLDEIKKYTGINCYLQNDANMAVWGAYDYEFKRKYSNMIGVTLGTGIGGGIIIDNKLYYGAMGTAGEFGHVLMVPGGKLCGCGYHGCFEAYCGTAGIIQMALDNLPKAPKNSMFATRLASTEKLMPRVIHELADAGDKTAKAVYKELGRIIGTGLCDICLILNPEVIVLAGGVSRAHKHFMPSLKAQFKLRGIKTPCENVKILVSSKENLGSIGAALFALEQLNKQ